MKKYVGLIVSIVACILAIALIVVLIINWNDYPVATFRYWFTEKTGLFYPRPQKIESVEDIREIAPIYLPDDMKLVDYIVENNEADSAMYIEIAPYSYYILLEFPDESSAEDFSAYVKEQPDDMYVYGDESGIDIVNHFGYDEDDISMTFRPWFFIHFSSGRTSGGCLIHVLEEHNRLIIFI